MNKTISICLIGFGNAAKAFCKLLDEKQEEISNKYDTDVKIKAVATKTKGSLLNTEGLNIKKMLKCIETNGQFTGYNEDCVAYDNLTLIEKSGADVLIELSALSIKDGQPAISHIEKAFANNMHVITGNKGPIAWNYKHIKTLAKEKNLELLHETTVMDGTPIFNLVKNTLPGCKILGFRGILNTTTNFILEEIERGSSFDDAVKEAQKRGFAEADPSMDIDGWDAAAKTCALINVLMNYTINPFEIKREGINSITYEDISKAKDEGFKIKLLCEGYIDNNKVKGIVHPVKVSMTDTFSSVDSTTSIISIKTDLMGEIYILEKNPEIEQTAYGIYSDLLTLVNTVCKVF